MATQPVLICMADVEPHKRTADYTPGPWRYERQTRTAELTAIGEPIAVVGGEANGEDVEFVVGRTCDFGPHGNEQTEANARLIAESPNLLAVCEDNDDPGFELVKHLNEARSILIEAAKKARGEQ